MPGTQLHRQGLSRGRNNLAHESRRHARAIFILKRSPLSTDAALCCSSDCRFLITSIETGDVIFVSHTSWGKSMAARRLHWEKIFENLFAGYKDRSCEI